jgi:hypothetical protein
MYNIIAQRSIIEGIELRPLQGPSHMQERANYDHGRNVNTAIVSKEMPRPAKIKMSGTIKVTDADSGVSDTKEIMPARTSSVPVSVVPSPIILEINGILFFGI